MTVSVRAVLVAVLMSVVALGGEAFAQAGAGAERYEVTITPPKRPGSEPAPEAAPVASEPDASREAATPAPGVQAAPAVSDSAVAPAQTASPRPASSLPMRTLQVGAFRQSKSATTLHDELAASFPDVVVVEVQSGGEPLYRVYVGLMPHSAALDDLRKKLVAAGHPAFEVPAPTVPVPQ